VKKSSPDEQRGRGIETERKGKPVSLAVKKSSPVRQRGRGIKKVSAESAGSCHLPDTGSTDIGLESMGK
jgi:hypothetical protein